MEIYCDARSYESQITLLESFKVDITKYIQVGQFERRSASLRLSRESRQLKVAVLAIKTATKL
jgi:hypothetical protein